MDSVRPYVGIYVRHACTLGNQGKLKYFFWNGSMHIKRTQTALIERSTYETFKQPFSNQLGNLQQKPIISIMAGFQHTSLLNFFDESNASLVKALAAKYGFDAADAMSHLKGIDASPVPTKAKKGKKAKDPNAPKRSPTAFFLFSKQYREEHAAEITGMKASEVAKLAGAAWSEVKDTEAAQSFHTEAAELKVAAAAARERYESERESTPEPAQEAAAPATPDQPTAPVEPKAPKKAPKKKAAKKEKPAVPELPLPFLGAIDGCCHGIRNNHGLYTQCTKVPGKDCGNFCKTCFTQAQKNQHGLPNCGTIEGRGEAGWRAPNGQQPVTYMTFLQKSGNHQAIIDDHAVADAEAAKFGWTIPAAQWEAKARRSGRPKAAKTAVVTDSSASETESPAPAADLIQKLVAEAQAEQVEVGAPVVQEMPAVDLTATVTEADLMASVSEPASNPAEAYEQETDDEADEPPLKVSPFTFDGVAYLLDKATNDIYCSVTHEKIGVLLSDPEQHIQFDDAPTDGEESDDEDH